MKTLLLAFRIWIWANVFVCLLPRMESLSFFGRLGAYVFSSSVPVFYLLLLVLAAVRALRLSPRRAWTLFLLVVFAGTVVGSGIMAWRSDAVDWPGAFSFVLVGAGLTLLLHQRPLHHHFKTLRNETE